MACSVPPSLRKAYVQRVVRESIKEVDGRNPPPSVTQDTLLGPSGLGHSTTLRRRYHRAVRDRLAQNECVMRTLTPESFAAPALVRVRDVTALVEGDMK
jgi:hypothetical protein